MARYEIRVCMNRRMAGTKPCCASRGAEAVFRELEQHIDHLRLQDEVTVRRSGCLDLCEEGPAVCIVDRGTGAAPALLRGIRSWFPANRAFRVRVRPQDAAGMLTELGFNPSKE
jgi:hypothetical protein